jgi:hypothetical protein
VRIEKIVSMRCPGKCHQGRAPDQAPTEGRLAAAISTICASLRRSRDEVARNSEFTRCISIALRTAKRAGYPPKLAMTASPVESFAEIAMAALANSPAAEALCLARHPSQVIILRPSGTLPSPEGLIID